MVCREVTMSKDSCKDSGKVGIRLSLNTAPTRCSVISESTLVRWAKYGIVKRHAYNGYIGLYEPPGPHVPAKQCSRWKQLAHRAEIIRQLNSSKCIDPKERAVV
jgi:hypothetical protein